VSAQVLHQIAKALGTKVLPGSIRVTAACHTCRALIGGDLWLLVRWDPDDGPVGAFATCRKCAIDARRRTLLDSEAVYSPAGERYPARQLPSWCFS